MRDVRGGEMGRTIKKGVDYFSHDVNASDKKTLYILESKFGNDGYAFWFKLLELLGLEQEHYYDCNDNAKWLFLIARTHVNEISAAEMLDMLARMETIDPELWEKRIIWCQNFVDRLEGLYKKRSVALPKKPGFRRENDDFRSENTLESDISAPKSTQIKLNKSKVNKSIDIYMPASGEASDCDKQQQQSVECAKTATEAKPSALTVGKFAAGDYPDAFEKFWSHYPKKTEKKAAFKCWKARIKAGISPDDMTKAVLNYVEYLSNSKTPEQYIKQAKTFIGPNEAYLDYINPDQKHEINKPDEVDEWLKRKRVEDDA